MLIHYCAHLVVKRIHASRWSVCIRGQTAEVWQSILGAGAWVCAVWVHWGVEGALQMTEEVS